MKTRVAAVLGLAGMLIGGSTARAELYPVPILVTEEQDLRDLFDDGDIDEGDFVRLSELLAAPIDPNRATPNELFDLPGVTYPMIDAIVGARQEQRFESVDDLAAVGLPRAVVRQITAFVYFPDAEPEGRAPGRVRGLVKVNIIDEIGDTRRNTDDEPFNPATALRARVAMRGVGEAGVAFLLQDRVGRFTYHHENGGTWISADQRRIRPELSKAYILTEQSNWHFTAGTYQLGFGERLVMAETDRQRPNGFYRDGLVSEDADGADFDTRQRLLGAAGGVHDIKLGSAGRLDATLFLSWFPRDAFQNDIDSKLRPTDVTLFNPSGPNPLYCEDSVAALDCARATDPVGRFSSETIRGAFTEALFGGHVGWEPTTKLRLGTTAYYAMVDFRKTDDHFFTPSAAYPDRDGFGAFGFDIQAWVERLALSGEYARTFEGDNAGLLRLALGWDHIDLELLGWYYDPDYDNPHARGTAEPDEEDGQRDRNESGARARVTFFPTQWLYTRFDVVYWRQLREEVDSLRLEARADVRIAQPLTVATGLRYTDKDLSAGGRDKVVDGDEAQGAQMIWWLQLDIDPLDSLNLRLRTNWTFADDRVGVTDTKGASVTLYEDSFRHDWWHWIQVTARVIEGLTLQARVRYEDLETGLGSGADSVEFSTRGEATLEAWGQLRWRMNPRWTWQLRYRVRAFIDDRTTSADTDTQHLLKASVEHRF